MRIPPCARRPLSCIAALFLVLGLRHAEAQTLTLKFQNPSLAVTGAYDAGAGLTAAYTMTVRHRGAAASYFITFPAGQSADFSARRLANGAYGLDYRIYDNMTARDALKDLSANPTSSEVLSGSFPASTAGWNTQTQSFTLYVPAGQTPPAGSYADTLTLGLYEGTPSQPGALMDSLTCTLAVTVPTSLAISLVPRGAAFDAASTALGLDFGILSAAGAVGGDLMVRSNVPYSVLVTSANGGVLAMAGSPDTVPYVFRVDGSVVSLSAGAAQTIVSAAGYTSSGGASYLLNFTVGSLGWPAEGTYTDLLTFSVTTP